MDELLHSETLTGQDPLRFDRDFNEGELVYAERRSSEMFILPLFLTDLPRFRGQPYQVIKEESSGEMILNPIDLGEVWKQVDFHELWLKQVEVYSDFSKHLVEKFCNPKYAPAIKLDDEETHVARDAALRVVQANFSQFPRSPEV